MEEIWKDVKGFESLYMVSNLGRVKNVPHYVTRKYYRPSTGDNIEDKLYIKEVLLNPKKKYHHKDSLPCVNHKDENKLNNCVDNLEWCTYQHNNVWKNRLAKSLETFNANPKNRRKVYQYTKDGAFIKEYESVKEATKEMGLKHSSGIHLSCNHNNCYARGFKWSFNSPSL